LPRSSLTELRHVERFPFHFRELFLLVLRQDFGGLRGLLLAELPHLCEPFRLISPAGEDFALLGRKSPSILKSCGKSWRQSRRSRTPNTAEC
jgi:hypothetical protein